MDGFLDGPGGQRQGKGNIWRPIGRVGRGWEARRLPVIPPFAKEQAALLGETPVSQETKGELRQLCAQYAVAARRMWSTGWDAMVLLFEAGGIHSAPPLGL